MKGSQFTENQIVSILKKADAGTRVKDICRQHGISDAIEFPILNYYYVKSMTLIMLKEKFVTPEKTIESHCY